MIRRTKGPHILTRIEGDCLGDSTTKNVPVKSIDSRSRGIRCRLLVGSTSESRSLEMGISSTDSKRNRRAGIPKNDSDKRRASTIEKKPNSQVAIKVALCVPSKWILDPATYKSVHLLKPLPGRMRSHLPPSFGDTHIITRLIVDRK
ncbi:unnamed protein product [Protopolystoma xenopodis]|uniref:Uncharacterized protein n=1 Tax=Protopolystoma xenopodis TaxID=117903 RepID=A0A3S4ZW89_9PLAT|nr:unnamed protein product [Protopolystoma xenopodis]